MQTVRDVMAIWPTIVDMHQELQIPLQTLYSMRRRNSIKQQYWPVLIEAARRRGRKEVTSEFLMRLHAAAALHDARKNTKEFQSLVNKGARPTENRDDKENVQNGHFSRFRSYREARFSSLEQINEHIAALRDEWER